MVATFSDLYLDARRSLRDAGIEDGGFEARLLLSHAAGCTVEELLQRMPLYAGDTVVERFGACMSRRLRGEPVAYITGSWEFYGLEIAVTPDVLIPRQDTEVLAETAIATLRGRFAAPRVLELGCGSGCISCALGSALPTARLTLTDISPAALDVARRNLAVNRLSRRAVCLHSDMLQPPPEALGEFDLLISNPPYIASAEVDTLDPSVRDWEPRLALDGGEDGLKFYRSIISSWLSVLSDSGYVMMEVGEDQAAPVMALMREAGLTKVRAVPDTAGTDRVVCGCRPGKPDEKQI